MGDPGSSLYKDMPLIMPFELCEILWLNSK